MPSIEEQVQLLMRGVVYGDEGVARAMESDLRERLAEGRPLRVYLGIDPTAPDLTLGHTVPMRKMRQFQRLGHETVLLIGGFTALVGDPSDKESTRPMLTLEEIEANARTYTDQAFKVLDRERTIVRNNAEWLSKLTFEELIKIASHFTVGQFLQRDNFAKRRDRSEPIYVHEFFYAFMQAYDAVALQTDAQIGATEQLFNLMAGRTLQRAYGQRPQIAVCMPILVGTDGQLRMSKTQGNYIALNDPPEEMYGKVMSLPDNVMLDYFTLVTDVPEEEIEETRRKLAERSVNPMDVKKRLAREIVTELHSAEAAEKAEERFVSTFQERELPLDMREYDARGLITLRSPGMSPQVVLDDKRRYLPRILKEAGLVRSVKEGERLILQGGVVRVREGTEMKVTETLIDVRGGDAFRVGKHQFLRIVDADKPS
ncbi:MAG: tyrosine--tRNA ligase [Dehalococcoidia bacterium]|jgi:tyrosyl-tRNA synthetase